MLLNSPFIKRKRYVKQLLVSNSLLLLLSVVTFAQERTVTGTVTSNSDGLPLPSVNVIVQGTSTGTITNTEGNFSLGIPAGDISLQFSFTGYTVQVVEVGKSTVIDVSLEPSLTAIDAVVITSLGIAREKKRITYSAQNVETDNVAQARELNVANSLQGKVAGLDVIKSSSGIGSASRVVLRGNRFITGNNQPLYIVDGVPIQNFSWGTPDREYGEGLQGGDGIGNINPDDIASITVLKGPNATALYGARANNGAIVLTTRQGPAGKGIGVEFNTNLSMDKALILTRFQDVYGQGIGGTYIRDSEEEWGPKMEGQMVDHWSHDPNFAGPAKYAYSPHNNFEDFFGTGYNIANTLVLTAGNEKLRSLFSYTNTISQGIVENNKLRRNNFNLRIDGNLTDKFSFDTKLTYFNQRVDNRLATGGIANNPMRAILRQPSNIPLEQAKQYEYFDDVGTRLQHYWNPNNFKGGQNIYWMMNRTIREETRDRILGLASLRYNFTDHLSLMVRSSFDQIFEKGSFKQYANMYYEALNGNLTLDDRNAMEFNGDFLLNYKKIWGDDIFSLNTSFGGNMLIQKSQTLKTYTDGLLKPDLFVITNTSQIGSSQGGSEKQINSLYGFATLGFKNFLYLDVTGRNDWSSTLPKDNWSYFYPSVGLTWIITEMLSTNPLILTFAKLRASYAEVGNDTDPYKLNITYSFRPGGVLGYAHRDPILTQQDLKPENTKSIEFGFDARFLNNRLGLDFTWYKSNTFNQLLSIPLPAASGYTAKFINAGNVQNKGVEITLNATPVIAGDFSWDVSFNYAKNENMVIKLTDDLKEYTTRGKNWMTTIKVVEGELYGQIHTRGFRRDDQGRIWINDLGLPSLSLGQTMPMGHANPDWIGGLSNRFKWKGFNLSILIDMRMGGDIFACTEANLSFAGFSEATLKGREGFVVSGVMESDSSENMIETTAEDYWHYLGARGQAVGEPFRYDASYVRVREVILGYSFRINSNVIQGIDLALYGRNLGFLHNASEIIDPNISVGTGNVQGLECLSVPSARTYGFNARFKF